MIRIANGQGFWGDWLEAPVRLIDEGPLDYLTLDYLAEVTMSVLQKQRQADPRLGYARDFPPLIGRIAKKLVERDIRVIANAGGVNPMACARAVAEAAPGVKIAVVLGDDVLGRLDEFLEKGYELRDIDTGRPLAEIRDRVLSANAYIGAFPLAEALATGARVVISGRAADAALALAPMVHRFGWRPTDWDRLAAGVVAGHIIECGTQATGGNSQVDWKTIPNMAAIGYPIVEAEPDGTFAVTKHAGTGGRVNSHTVKEQLVYEIGDPRRYATPDCVADFTSIRVEDAGPDRVRVTGARGGPRPEMLKLSVSYAAGWKAVGTLVYSWPEALEKARCADAIVRERLARLGLRVRRDPHGVLRRQRVPRPGRAARRRPRRGAVAHRRARPEPRSRGALHARNGAAGAERAAGRHRLRGRRPKVREVVAYFGALVPREEIRTRVEVIE